jgi:3-oxoacyl-[acyl-carrier-protein] synthase-1
VPQRNIFITAIGMATSLGLDAANSCAASRAGISRAASLKSMNFQGASCFGKETPDGFPPFCGHASSIDAGYTGRARLAILGSAALRDLLSSAGLTNAELASTGFYLNLSDRFVESAYAAMMEHGSVPQELSYPHDQWKNESPQITDLLLNKAGIYVSKASRMLYYGGHAGLVSALNDAGDALSSGRFERSIVGGVDCCIEPRFLEAAATLRMVKTADNPVGFIPGEGAAFVLLEHSGRRCGNAPQLVSSSFAHDEGHLFTENPPIGRGIAAAVRESVHSGGVRPSFVVADLNGSERRALDWGHAITRLNGAARIGDLPVWLPAASFGETGAAAAATAVCSAIQAWRRRYAPGPAAIITAASDSSARGAILLVRQLG